MLLRRVPLLAFLLVAPLAAQAPGPAAPTTAPTTTPTAVPAAAPATASDDARAARLRVDYRQFTLDNGLNVILHQDRSVPTVAMNLWYHVGSANERPGRTGFAHLFEHLMFEGSGHVPEGEFDRLLEAAGGNNNGSTNTDRTNYVIDVPSSALELALYLESDRMGYLLETMSPERVDGQRDVVKNERRQNYENRPYGMASLELAQMLWPEGHPYRWPTIGHMEDLTAASYEDVVQFFRTYYAPNNASLVIAGDIDYERTRALVEKWFGGIPRGPDVAPLSVPAVRLTEVTRKTITDRVRLPRLYIEWPTPEAYAPGEPALDLAAYVLGGGKNSRLYKRLVYDTQAVQDVAAFQASSALAGTFMVVATARPGQNIDDIRRVIDEEIERLKREPPDAREVQRALNAIESSFYRQMESVGGFGGKSNQLNAYWFAGATPDFFAEDLARYLAISPADVQAAAARWLPADRRVELVVEPEAQP
ncbi:MAG: M16 family metallopeptidase [Vicinamibacterales bacterium]